MMVEKSSWESVQLQSHRSSGNWALYHQSDQREVCLSISQTQQMQCSSFGQVYMLPSNATQRENFRPLLQWGSWDESDLSGAARQMGGSLDTLREASFPKHIGDGQADRSWSFLRDWGWGSWGQAFKMHDLKSIIPSCFKNQSDFLK